MFAIFLIANKAAYSQYVTIRERVQHLQDIDEKLIRYGYYFGFNNFGYKIEYIDSSRSNLGIKPYSAPTNLGGQGLPDIELVKNFGFNVGLVSDLRINRFLNLRFEPGLYYTQRDLIYPESTPLLTKDADYLRSVKSTYIHLPLLIKFSSIRVNNFKPYLIGGVSTSFNLSSNEKSVDDNSSAIFRVTSQTYNYEIGFGIDFYLPYFKFSPSIRGIFSLQNELIPDSNPLSPWTSNIKNLYTQGIVINLNFR